MRPQLVIGQMQHLPTHAFGLTLMLASILIGYWFGLKPWQHSERLLSQTRAENEQLQANAANVEAEIERISSDIRSKQGELARRHSIPTDPNQPLLELVSRMLSEHNLVLNSLREESSPATSSITLSLQISGRYMDLLQLMIELRQLERPARIKALALTPADVSGEVCNAKLSIGFASANAMRLIDLKTQGEARTAD